MYKIEYPCSTSWVQTPVEPECKHFNFALIIVSEIIMNNIASTEPQLKKFFKFKNIFWFFVIKIHQLCPIQSA